MVNIRVAYCLTVHKNPAQVGRLLEAIYRPDDHYYIDVFNAVEGKLPPEWERTFARFGGDNLTAVCKYANGWGSFKLVQATLDAMEHFRSRDYDYFINLSGQCYPLRPVEEIKERLKAADGKGFMEYEPFPRPRWVDEGGGYRRIKKVWYKPFADGQPWSFPRLMRMPLGMYPYGGAQWFCLHQIHIEYVLGQLEEHPEIIKYFQRTLIPDEDFFQTILMNSPLAGTIVNDSKRFIDWEKRCVPLPAMLLAEDYDRLVSSDKFFARKFDVDFDPTILDLLDARLRAEEAGQVREITKPSTEEAEEKLAGREKREKVVAQ